MIALPDLCLVDVNVGIVANGAGKVCPECELHCVEVLQAIMDRGRVAVDNLDRIWDEYMTHLEISGEPGMGDQFLRWIHENQWGGGRCEQVPITPTTADDLNLEEFPTDPALSTFDRSDRKYVAVSVVPSGCLGPATILNATDSDWKHHEAALVANGVPVAHLCPVELKELKN
jgi:hypothetical protein